MDDFLEKHNLPSMTQEEKTPKCCIFFNVEFIISVFKILYWRVAPI